MKPVVSIKPLVEVWSSREADCQLVEDTDAKGRKRLTLETIVQRADAKNRNNRVYPRKVMERVIRDFQTHIDEGTSYGEADHPKPGENPSVMRQAVLWREIGMDEHGTVRAKGTILDTDAGRQVKGLVEGGGAIGTSSRGRGTVSLKTEATGGGQVEVVNDDYQLRTFDLVIDQSVPEAQSRLVRYEQHLIEQESQTHSSTEKTTMTLEELKAKHPELYAAIVAEAQKSDKDTLDARVEAILGERTEAIKAEVLEGARASGMLLDEERAVRFSGLEAFAAVIVEGAKEIGLLDDVALTEDEAASRIEELKTENAALKRKVEALEATVAHLGEKTGKTEVEVAAKKLAENHGCMVELTESLVDSCADMNEFAAKKDAIKARFDKIAKRLVETKETARTGDDLTDRGNTPPGGKKPEGEVVELTETQRHIRGHAGVRG